MKVDGICKQRRAFLLMNDNRTDEVGQGVFF